MAASGNILVLANGSRGDCQPYVALCAGLQKLGFTVSIFTNPDHEQMSCGCNIPYHNNTTPFKEVFTSKKANKAFTQQNLFKWVDTLSEHNAKHGPAMIRKLHELLTCKDKPDVVVCGTQHWVDFIWIYDLFKIPCVVITLSSGLTPNYNKAPLGLPSACGLWNMTLWKVLYHQFGRGLLYGYGFELGKLVGKSPKEFFPDRHDFMSAGQMDDLFDCVPYIIGHSETILGRQPFDKPDLLYTGALKLELDTMQGADFGGARNDELKRFLSAGPEPVYIGWGSVLVGTRESLAGLAVRTLMAAGQRGVVLGGWAGITKHSVKNEKDADALMAYCDRNVFFMDTAKHEELFPQCSVIVHHGGSGTSAAGFSSGRPNIITPILYDQFDFAERFEEVGTGLSAGHLPKVTPEKLAGLIKRCLADEVMQAKAKDVARQLQAEVGSEIAAAAVAKFFHEQVQTGKFEKAMDIVTERRAARKKSWCFCCARRPRTKPAPSPTVVAEGP